MSYQEERQKINIAVARYEAGLNRKVFEEFFKAGKEQELLIYETTFDERGRLFGFKRMMWKKFKKDEITEEIKNPEYFFQHGWFFPENKAKLEKDVVTCEDKMAYHLHTSLPPQCFSNAEFVAKLHNSLENFWDTFKIENCKNYDIEQLKFGYQNGINSMQLKAMTNLKNKIDILEENLSICENNEKKLIKDEQKKCALKLTKLLSLPLFKTDINTSQKIYKKLGLLNPEKEIAK